MHTFSASGVQLTFDGISTSTRDLIPSCGGLGKTKFITTSTFVAAKPLLLNSSINSTTWMLADSSGRYLRVVEITIEMRSGNLWGKASLAWYISQSGLGNTDSLSSEQVISKREGRTEVPVVDTRDGKGYAVNWFVYRFESAPVFALQDGPTEGRYSADELEAYVSLARHQFMFYMANVSSDGEEPIVSQAA